MITYLEIFVEVVRWWMLSAPDVAYMHQSLKEVGMDIPGTHLNYCSIDFAGNVLQADRLWFCQSSLKMTEDHLAYNVLVIVGPDCMQVLHIHST